MKPLKPLMMPPGALRLRTLYPLVDGDNSCTLIYDLERSAVLDVPEELQFHVATALERGDLDEDLLGWLVNEDLYTLERFADGDGADPDLGDATWSGFATRDGEFHAQLEPASGEGVLEALDVAFKQGMGASRIALHLSWGGAFPGDELLSRIVVEATRRAACARQEVRFELALDAWAVNPAVAAFLADHPRLQVRLHCGTFPALEPGSALPGEDRIWRLAERGVHLLSGMAGRLTVQCVLAGSARLHDLWTWARDAGILRLDATRLEPVSSAGAGSELRQYRGDLMAICEEISAVLEDGETPIEYQPLTRAVRRLMRSEPLSMPSLDRGTFSSRPRGWASALSPQESDLRLLSDMWLGLDDGEAGEGMDLETAGGGVPCINCWARYICHHSLLATPAANCSDHREPAAERCACWRIEAEVALRLYHRLAQVDALEVRRLFEEEGELPIDLGARRGGWQQKMAF